MGRPSPWPKRDRSASSTRRVSTLCGRSSHSRRAGVATLRPLLKAAKRLESVDAGLARATADLLLDGLAAGFSQGLAAGFPVLRKPCGPSAATCRYTRSCVGYQWPTRRLCTSGMTNIG
jgi:hypothetical protein